MYHVISVMVLTLYICSQLSLSLRQGLVECLFLLDIFLFLVKKNKASTFLGVPTPDRISQLNYKKKKKKKEDQSSCFVLLIAGTDNFIFPLLTSVYM